MTTWDPNQLWYNGTRPTHRLVTRQKPRATRLEMAPYCRLFCRNGHYSGEHGEDKTDRPNANHGKYRHCRTCSQPAIQARRHARALRESHTTQTLRTERLAAQNNQCAGCSTPLTTATARTDHDHNCHPGQIPCHYCFRGILCDMCNRGLGFLRDSTTTLRQLADYLDAHNNRQPALTPNDTKLYQLFAPPPSEAS